MLQFKLTYVFENSRLFTFIYNLHVKVGKLIVFTAAKVLSYKERYFPSVRNKVVIIFLERLLDMHTIVGMYIMYIWRIFYPFMDVQEYISIYDLCKSWLNTYGFIDSRQVEFAIFHKFSFSGARNVTIVVRDLYKDVCISSSEPA